MSKPKPKNKEAVLLWSGGYDSTAAMLYAFEHYTYIRLVTINFPQLTNHKMKREERARQKILQRKSIREKSKGIKTITTQYKLPKTTCFNVGSHGFFQQPFFLTMGLSIITDKQDLILGWHQGENIHFYRHELEESFGHLKKVYGKPQSNLYIPLIQHTKYQVLEMLEQFDEQLLFLPETCESDKKLTIAKSMCGCCGPCRTLKIALMCSKIKMKNYERLMNRFVDPFYERVGIKSTLHMDSV